MAVSVDLPRYSVKKILSTKAELAKAGTPYVNRVLAGSVFGDFCRDITDAFPASHYQRTVELSLLGLANTKLLAADLQQAAWRLAANESKLLEFEPVLPWIGQTVSEWMPLQVVETTPHFYKPRQRGAIFCFRILAGSAAGLVTHRFWTRRFCKYMAHDLGFSAAYGDYPFATEDQLVGLRLWGYFTPELCARENLPKFDQVRVPSSFVSYNKERIRARFPGQPKYSCQYKIPCHQCPIGKDRCAQATHLRTYVEALCPMCGNPNALHDPKFLQKQRCLDCDLKWKSENCKGK
jgi:hypothetical protein